MDTPRCQTEKYGSTNKVENRSFRMARNLRTDWFKLRRGGCRGGWSSSYLYVQTVCRRGVCVIIWCGMKCGAALARWFHKVFAWYGWLRVHRSGTHYVKSIGSSSDRSLPRPGRWPANKNNVQVYNGPARTKNKIKLGNKDKGQRTTCKPNHNEQHQIITIRTNENQEETTTHQNNNQELSW